MTLEKVDKGLLYLTFSLLMTDIMASPTKEKEALNQYMEQHSQRFSNLDDETSDMILLFLGGKEKTAKVLIDTLKEFGVKDNIISNKLRKDLNFSEEEIKRFLNS